jgi:hypothetical protein
MPDGRRFHLNDQHSALAHKPNIPVYGQVGFRKSSEQRGPHASNIPRTGKIVGGARNIAGNVAPPSYSSGKSRHGG